MAVANERNHYGYNNCYKPVNENLNTEKALSKEIAAIKKKKEKKSDIESNKDNVIDNYAKYSIDDIDSMSEDELIMAAVDCIYREPETALAFLEPAADKDNKDALFLMGYIYGEVYRWQGRPDYEKALPRSWLSRS